MTSAPLTGPICPARAARVDSATTDIGILIPKRSDEGTAWACSPAYNRQLVRLTTTPIASSQVAVRFTGMMVARERQMSMTGEPIRVSG